MNTYTVRPYVDAPFTSDVVSLRQITSSSRSLRKSEMTFGESARRTAAIFCLQVIIWFRRNWWIVLRSVIWIMLGCVSYNRLHALRQIPDVIGGEALLRAACWGNAFRIALQEK